jgi:hypothetical protein
MLRRNSKVKMMTNKITNKMSQNQRPGVPQVMATPTGLARYVPGSFPKGN